MPNFKKTAKQEQATLLHLKGYTHVMLYGGSRSGKTFIDIRNMILRAFRLKSRHLVARYRFNAVKRAVVLDTFPKVMALCFPEMKWELNKTDWYVTFSNGSEIWFGGLDDKDRLDKILGNEYSTIKLNECSEISWLARNTVFSRLAENSGLPLLFMYDCNPTSKKHWTSTVFLDGKSPDGEQIKGHKEKYISLQMNPQDNLANLPKEYMDILNGLPARERKRFLEGEFQDDIEGALWNFAMITKAKNLLPQMELKKKVVAIDPAVTNKKDSDLTGIVICGLDINNNGAVLADYSCKDTPNGWANRAINAYHKHECNEIVVEVNNGGDMCKQIIHNIDSTIRIKQVRASTGKFARAEPIAAFYEQNRVYHAENLVDLESELMEYVPLSSSKSPDRLDAMVWGLSYLMLKPKREVAIW